MALDRHAVSNPAPAVATRARIVDASIRCIVRDGVDRASMAAIAAAAGVSKGLLHYHYADRAQLLGGVVAALAARIAGRERAAIDAAEGSDSVDALWRWLEGELARGELRALLELGFTREPAVRVAADAAALHRHAASTHTVEQLFERLGLVPRLPAALLGAATVAFTDGLAAGNAGAHAGPVVNDDPRVSFDVFWLALLGLAE
jgi:AcrR family transcriptional regulator